MKPAMILRPPTAVLSILMLAIASITLTAQPMDDRDIQLNPPGAEPPARMIEIDYTDDGFLVAAYVEPDPTQDRVRILSRDPSRNWSTLYHGVLGNLRKIVHLDMDTADHAGAPFEKRVFIGVTALWNPSKPLSFYGLLSGRYDQPWQSAKCRPMVSRWGDYTTDHRGLRTSVAVIPDFNGDYAVGVAFKMNYRYWGETVQVFYSLDHGDSLQIARMIAGPDGEAIDVSQGATFGYPSLTFSEAGRSVVLAFHQTSTGQTHIAEETVQRHIMQQAALPVAASFGRLSDKRHHPHISVHSRGELNMTALVGDVDPRYNSHGLTMYHGITAGMIREFRKPNGDPALHNRAITPGEIEIRRSDAFVTAVCVTDPTPNMPGVAVFAWQADRDGWGEIIEEVINDTPVLAGIHASAPRVVRTPGGFLHTAVFAFAASNQSGLVSIDAEP